MNLLAIDCSSRRGSVAASMEGVLAGTWEVVGGRGTRGDLFRAVQKGLALAAPLDRVLVGIGPGSYNGIRSAISLAAGLRAATGCGLVPIPSPLGVEGGAAFDFVGDARGGQFHFTSVEAGAVVDGPRLILPEALEALLELAQRPVFAAESIDRFPDILCRPPTGPGLIRAGAGARPVPGVPEPLYLKPPHITPPRARKIPVENRPGPANSNG